MKTQFIDESFKYDGTQLRPLFAYLQYQILGNSVVSWIGPCDIPIEHMVDGEDLLAGAEIRGQEMLHFIFEIFDRELVTGVFLQRLFASLVRDQIEAKTGKSLRRSGDDLYWDDRKLSISIATKSTNSVMVHFAMNVVNDGTPVATCSLQDLKLEPKAFALDLLSLVSEEYENILEASYKVRSV